MRAVTKRLIGLARQHRASDVHFMPGPDDVAIHIRSGTRLDVMETISRSEYERLTLHMKYWCSLTETDQRVPQSGVYDAETAMIRVTFLPSFEHTLMSWRMPNMSFELGELVAEKDQMVFEQLGKMGHGLFLIGGATGAGKTTVLYALLEQINHRRIVTIENPPEQAIAGVIQLEVNVKAGLDHRSLLKETLRADPDVIVIGEVRTSEEFKVAHDAALSGHLTIATFHTSTIEDGERRLKELAGVMEMKRYWCVLQRGEEMTCSWSLPESCMN
ncbi:MULTISPECIES: ATPase, T2SS/T4P/T4SS family [Exiguobacterium]|uniref:ATPase, T2SS/T4P/T4SS family n=1 Tax=Exiguobacterium TaxID=33986 RepID=UPI001BE6298A|nr:MULTISPECIES: ATPase, T2SS/T4P/T4SS family [Exiguobacterium]MCT4784305.1 ATPase, T2SS/T4P/T4SS family [Exiguobacterium himgiriensis]